MIYTRLMFLWCGFAKLDLQYYLIMMCCNTRLLYWVIQLLWKHHMVHCLSLLMLSLWCYFYVYFQSFSEASSCFVEFQVDFLVFIIIICIFSEPHELGGLVGGVIGGVVVVSIILMIILGILFLRRKKGSIFNHLLGCLATI